MGAPGIIGGMATDHVVLRPDDEGVDAYRLLTALVVPRPIAWVSTISADGVGNLAPYSFFTVASADPPVVQVTSVGEKDTLRNARATGELTISLASEPLIDAVNATSAGVDPDVDEADRVGLAMAPSRVVTPPRVAGSPASLECRLRTTVPVGGATLLLADVVAFTIDPAVLDGDHPRFDLLAPLARLGGTEWGLPGEVVTRDRPS
ncbi:flavin reductase (DIM6/NTAB) family NADH-FMN oxidoreductase RutF [Nocardioides zeae]|uniref:Flavin reductase (DIM6/NTAB) family NADH-FMN oxidoreductase RutF n=1 Tax=Nocardioides zeae TaxID=1457234 RepID=A0ACC6IE41_9ACTN|nr:flavin reductase (DIM6/NTAB) family NADH-FMN oxidoreductase RutF [Nocardioides zeae]MDR6209041.1 flavin reductase (DIM6/NTAB) family NADH-FMN oxidoreductase RutF [Nocardioides zeae]